MRKRYHLSKLNLMPEALQLLEALKALGRIPEYCVAEGDIRDRFTLPESRGLYFVLDKAGHVFYIGRSSNFRTRWKHHHRVAECISYNATHIIAISFNSISHKDLVIAEDLVIKQVNSALNNNSVLSSDSKKFRLLRNYNSNFCVLAFIKKEYAQILTVDEFYNDQPPVLIINNDADITRVASAPLLSDSEFLEIKNSLPNITLDAFFRYKRNIIDSLYGLTHNEEGHTYEWLIAAHEDGLYSRLESERLLRAYALNDAKHLMHTFGINIGDYFKTDFNGENNHSRIQLLCDNGFSTLIEYYRTGESKGFNKHSEDFQTFWNGIKSLPDRDKQQLGRVITEKTDPLKFLSHVLKSFGFQLNKQGCNNKRRYTVSRYFSTEFLDKYQLEYADLQAFYDQFITYWNNRGLSYRAFWHINQPKTIARHITPSHTT